MTDESTTPPETPLHPWWLRKRTMWFAALCAMGGALVYLTFAVRSDVGASYTTHFRIGLAVGLALAAFVCEYFDSSLGMGYGTTLTPLLIILGFPVRDIIPAVMFSQMVSGFAAGAAHHTIGNVTFNRRSHDSHVTLALASCSLVGGAAAVVFTSHVPEHYLRIWVGCLILAIDLFSRRLPLGPPGP